MKSSSFFHLPNEMDGNHLRKYKTNHLFTISYKAKNKMEKIQDKMLSIYTRQQRIIFNSFQHSNFNSCKMKRWEYNVLEKLPLNNEKKKKKRKNVCNKFSLPQ